MATVISKSGVATSKLKTYYATLSKVRHIAVNLRSFSNSENSDETATPNSLKEGKKTTNTVCFSAIAYLINLFESY